MKLSNYEHVNDYMLTSELSANGYDYSEAQKIVEILDEKFDFYQRDKPVGESVLWRLSFPFYFISFILLFFIVSPPKYIITGSYYWNSKSRVYIFMNKWQKKLGI